MSERRARWGRLGISLAVALLLHALAASILVLAWRQFVPSDAVGPITVELAPPVMQSNGTATEPTFATVAAGVGRAESAGRAEIDRPFADFPSVAKVGAEASEPTFAARGEEAMPAAASATQNPANLASREGEPRPVPGAQLGNAPIDTRIVPSFRLPAKRPPRSLAHSSSPPAAPRRLSALPGNIMINAIGARVEDRARAALARANASGEGPRNAVGNTMPANAGNAAAGPSDSVAVNAIGTSVHVHPAGLPPANGAPGYGLNPSTSGRSAGAASGLNASALNGTGFAGHAATRAGSIGGAATSVSGALNGTDFRPRHP